MQSTIDNVKVFLRISHDKLDDEIDAQIKACLQDLVNCGIPYPRENDDLILNAIKIWCKIYFLDDVAKAEKFQERYDSMKASLMMAEGYGIE